MPAGRPTSYNEDRIEEANQYMDEYSSEEIGDAIPSVAGLAIYLGVTKKTLYNWGKEHEEFLHVLEKLNNFQEKVVLNGGIKGTYNATIAKLVLAKQGYSDKQELSGPDGEPVQLVAVDEERFLKAREDVLRQDDC